MALVGQLLLELLPAMWPKETLLAVNCLLVRLLLFLAVAGQLVVPRVLLLAAVFVFLHLPLSLALSAYQLRKCSHWGWLG